MADTTASKPKAASKPRAASAKAAAPKAASTSKKTAAKPKATTAKASTTSAASARTKAADTASTIRDQLNTTAETFRNEAQRKASEIGDELTKLYAQAGDRARAAANTGKSRAAGGLGSLARVIEDSAPQFDDTLGKQFGDFARSAATTVESLAGKLDQQDIDELIASTRDFVKKSPAVAIGSAAVVGFMLARMLKSNRAD